MKKEDLNSLEKLLAEREPKSDIYDKLNYWKVIGTKLIFVIFYVMNHLIITRL